MIPGYFIADGRRYELPVFIGVTTPKSIKDFAASQGWKKWDYYCHTLGIHETRTET